ncbi:MAG: hypothetical protein U0790_03165 [Isosphaeraceae bacterium]
MWDTIGPLFEEVFSTGEVTRQWDQLLPTHRPAEWDPGGMA